MLSKNKIKYIRSLEHKKYRTATSSFVAEGYKVVADLLPTFHCKCLVATSEWLDNNATALASLRQTVTEIHTVTDEELRKVSFQETPQQVLAVFQQPQWSADIYHIAQNNLCLALDDVQNPGNLGTIIRLADWFGIEHIFCSRNSADIYNPKTIQATMGAIARVQVHYVDLPSTLATIDSGIPIYGTSLNGDNIYTKPLAPNGIIIMGNEGKGVSAPVNALVTEQLYIPNYPKDRPTSESLNVAIATSIICAEFRRRIL
ncbi:MAG: RNA methyltransferase [Prevotellaceae bacterium]|nr:RNA methyltransferase [Prevotellaceae bacterium]